MFPHKRSAAKVSLDPRAEHIKDVNIASIKVVNMVFRVARLPCEPYPVWACRTRNKIVTSLSRCGGGRDDSDQHKLRPKNATASGSTRPFGDVRCCTKKSYSGERCAFRSGCSMRHQQPTNSQIPVRGHRWSNDRASADLAGRHDMPPLCPDYRAGGKGSAPIAEF
jgi:hypothetical protein